MKNRATQTYIDNASYNGLFAELERRTFEIIELKERISQLSLDECVFANDTAKLKFYTGFTCMRPIKVILCRLEPALNNIKNQKVSNFQKLLITLIKLRSNTSNLSLAYRFDLKTDEIKTTFARVVSSINNTLGKVIYWPQRDRGEKVTVVLDRFEIPIRSNQTAGGNGRTTVKYLMVRAPDGTIWYISKGYAGNVDDEQITKECGIMKKLLPGDKVFTDTS